MVSYMKMIWEGWKDNGALEDDDPNSLLPVSSLESRDAFLMRPHPSEGVRQQKGGRSTFGGAGLG